MSKVFSAHAVSVDGYITGRGARPGQGLGDGGTLFDWYSNGDTQSRVFDFERMSQDHRQRLASELEQQSRELGELAARFRPG